MEAVLLVVALAVGASAVSTRSAPATEELSLARPRPVPSTAPLGSDARDIRMYDAWVAHPGYAVTPKAIVSAFREAERGYPQQQCDLVDDLVENDCHARSLFEQREQAVAGKPWVIQADGQEGDAELAARVLGQALRRLPMAENYRHLLTCNRYGWAGLEIDWGLLEIEGRLWIVPVWLAPVPARRFRISASMMGSGGVDELRLYADSSRPGGDELRASKWIIMRRAGTWLARAGLMRSGSWPIMAKRYGFRDLLVFSQRFGLPLPVATYDPTADDNAIDVAEQAIRKIGSDGGAVVPNTIKIDFKDATGGDASRPHGGLIATCNAELSKLVNGSTLSNDNAGSGGASYALGAVHDGVRWDNVLYDAELLQEAVRTQLAAPFMAFNALRGAPPLLKLQVVRDLDPKTRVDIADTLVNKLGVSVSTAQLRQELGYREPVGPDDKAPGAPKQTPAAPSGAPA
jgi:phage gp29-like protein